MLALCLPLTVILESGVLLPILVILGVSSGTAVVWLSPDKHRQEDIVKIKTLEDRIINLEAIYASLPDAENLLQLIETDER